jgi:multidrug efflux pump subunit AcrA (membrane-fusion protein)
MKPNDTNSFRALGLALACALFFGCSKREAPEQAEHAEKHEDNIVILTKQNLEHVEIKTEVITPGDIEMTLKAAARVSENLNKTAKISSTLEGRLVKLNVDLNDRVKAGDVLALVQTPELLGRALELKAPIDGVIIDRKATTGELVSKEKEIYVISDPADLWVIAEVKERDIGAVKVGQDATFSVIAYPGDVFRGKVVRTGNQVEAESRTLEVRIDVDNSDGRLKAGMFADVEIVTTTLRDVVVIPDKAVQTDEDKQVVFVALDEHRFEKRVVRLGLERHGRVQVLEGVKLGEKLVTEGSFILKSEMLKGELGEE